jgi:hypothetical protein
MVVINFYGFKSLANFILHPKFASTGAFLNIPKGYLFFLTKKFLKKNKHEIFTFFTNNIINVKDVKVLL